MLGLPRNAHAETIAGRTWAQPLQDDHTLVRTAPQQKTAMAPLIGS